ncbi:MAG: T9SS type A sorting domain-containing protein [Bacteroidetes bacterium]|nr:T9SS type A sorting domain-containing protein [Bacteroidota bacterium]
MDCLTDERAEDRSDISTVETSTLNSTNLSIFPNPFNGITTVTFNLPLDQSVDIKVFNMDGKLVEQLVQPTTIQQAGSHQVTFNGTTLPNGVYFVSFITGDHQETKRVVLVK